MATFKIYGKRENGKEFKFEEETPVMARVKAMEAALRAHDNRAEVYQSDFLLYTVEYGIYTDFYDFIFISNMNNDPESICVSSKTGW